MNEYETLKCCVSVSKQREIRSPSSSLNFAYIRFRERKFAVSPSFSSLMSVVSVSDSFTTWSCLSQARNLMRKILLCLRQDSQTIRTLTLISKTIQSLGNLVSSRSSHQHAKEEFMADLYKKFCTEKHVEAVKKFLDAISTKGMMESLSNSCSTDEAILLKDG